MPSNPAALARRRQASRFILSGYGNAHWLIDFLNGYFLRGADFGEPGAAAPGVWGANSADPKAEPGAAEAASSSRRSGYGPDIGNLRGGMTTARYLPRRPPP